MTALMKNSPREIIQAEFRRITRKGPDDDIEDVPIAELGVDSLDFFETLIHLEEKFGIKIPVEKLDDTITLRSILALVND